MRNPSDAPPGSVRYARRFYGYAPPPGMIQVNKASGTHSVYAKSLQQAYQEGFLDALPLLFTEVFESKSLFTAPLVKRQEYATPDTISP